MCSATIRTNAYYWLLENPNRIACSKCADKLSVYTNYERAMGVIKK